jgi:hypothetical protein
MVVYVSLDGKQNFVPPGIFIQVCLDGPAKMGVAEYWKLRAAAANDYRRK